MTDDAAAKFLKALTGDSWMREAACGGMGRDGDAFFPAGGGAPKEARALCAGCPVKTACLQWSLDNDIHEGTWGGVSETERRPMLRPTIANGWCKRGHPPGERRTSHGRTWCRLCKNQDALKYTRRVS
jgi:WhiB family redox-sensing transcriptional regulator